MQSTLKALLRKDEDNLSRLAHKNAYYDQAHFNKDFKEFTGLTPKEFYGDNLKMSLIFESDE
jgi:AraC-like DNA-binding protein